jgi:hypothetical protein
MMSSKNSKSYNIKATQLRSNNSKLRKTIKKNRIMYLPDEFSKLNKCSSKKLFIKAMKNFPSTYKKYLQVYITDFLFFDVYTRKLKNRTRLLCRKTLFYNSISNPSILEHNSNVQNSEIKQFCSVSVKFLSKNMNHVKEVMKKKYSNK